MTENNVTLKKKNIVSKAPLTLIVGLFMVATLLGYIFGKQHDFSNVENRYLQMRPEFTWQGVSDGSFMKSFDTYTDEQMPLRSGLVKIKTIMDTAIGKIESHEIVKGSEGFLFDKSTKDLAQFEQNLSIIDKFIKDSNRRVYVTFAPTSSWINSDKLPVGTPVLDEEKMNASAESAFSVNPNATFIDLSDKLFEHKEENLFYRTDHHWKSLGAYYGYQEICKAISENDSFVDISELNKNVVSDFYGTFYAKYQALGVDGDTIEYYDVPVESYQADKESFDSIYDKEKLEIYDKYAVFMRGNYGRATVKSGNNTGRELVIFKDSYANSLIPFLCYNYDTIEIADLRYMGGSVKEFLEEHPDADVMMMYNYSFLNDDKHFYKLLQ